ncbi:MAG: hypothetical protein NTX97_12230, partial [Bacteroidetes bacterium]|nr:hypothetical protein [Bacteroidota bacterium]
MITFKKYLFIFLLLLILIPGIQQRFPFFDPAPLNGSFHLAEVPSFSWSTWFSGDFQTKFEKGLEPTIGFHNSFVRLNNQINYSLFNFASARNVIVGKDHCLYEEYYITSTLGNDYVNEDSIKAKIEKIKFVQDELERRGKHLLILLAPSKASYFPEFIPDRYHPEIKKTTNYNILCKLLGNSRLNYIDFNSYFLKLKKTSPYPLFSKQGTHWSYYGA